MRRRLIDSSVSAGVLTLAALSWPFAAPSRAASGNIGATMTTDMSFGSVLAPTSGTATLTLEPSTNTRTYAGTTVGSGATRGVIAISNGDPGTTYTWSLSPASVALGTSTFTPSYYSVNAASSTSGLFSASGTDTLYFGGTGPIAAGATAGAFNDAPTLTITPSAQSARTERLKFLITVVTPVSVTKTRDLSFGTVTSTGTAGTITVPAVRTGTNTATGGASTVTNGTSGEFAISGAAQTAVVMSVSPTPLTLTGPGSASMTASAWTMSPTSPVTLPNNGSQTVYVGGTLNVGASQAQGSYSGIVTFTVNYQ